MSRPIHRPPCSSAERGLARIVGLVVLTILLLAGGAYLLLAHHTGRRGAYKVQCISNLKLIYTCALQYSNKPSAHEAYPIALGKEPRAHESLNLLVKFSDFLPVKLWTCPEGDAVPAEVNPDDRNGYTLEEENLDYAWVREPTLNTTSWKALSSDKYIEGDRDATGRRRSGHARGMNVLSTDGSAALTEEANLPGATRLPEGLTR